ncbi:T-cell-interacting, activating receptor on myeloid cells protein 1 isoform X2 [Castor canadensis]|uniref:T-cell-interacting, activating receptor on myeloid cells protein 1 isoform X2 n=1 Tax=Castor canadensis TaxID=51338 RepID=UPI000981591C|nr:T-cell-interacting, activating receptor on myeloid cells protein 1-like isoform X2 [Castor canadensis]
MIPRLLSLLCVRLCVGQEDISGDGSLPKPSLSAWPSSVVPTRNNVTLQCMSSTPGAYFVLRKEEAILESRPSRLSIELTEGAAKFHLIELWPSDAGHYTCEYYRKGFPNTTSQPSNVLLLLVTGYLSKPSLLAHQRGKVTTGGNVTLQCKKEDNGVMPLMFILLKTGVPSPIQFRSPSGTVSDFTFHNVTAKDSGNYSCVYYRSKAPFWASVPSNSLEILVTGSPSAMVEGYTKCNLIRLGMAAVIMVIIGVILVEAWHSQRKSPGEPRPHSAPGEW